MNLFKQLYLRIFKGYIKTNESGKAMIKLFTFCSPSQPEYIALGKGWWLISPPKKVL